MADQVEAPGSERNTSRDIARWLTTPDGLVAINEATRSLDREAAADAHLRTLTLLRRSGLSQPRAAMVVEAAMARHAARTSAHHAADWLMTLSALEQGSDPVVSQWRARRYIGAQRIWDLCAGVGFDAFNLAAHATVHAVEIDPIRAVFADWNLRDLSHPVTVAEADVLAITAPATALVHADPSRRSGGRRLRTLATYRPAVDQLVDVHRNSPGLGIVISPGIDWDDDVLADLTQRQKIGVEVEFVQHDRRLIEGMLWMGALRASGVLASATVLRDGQVHHRIRMLPPRSTEVRAIGSTLIRPAPAVVRARLHDELADEIGAWRVSRRRALLSSDHRPAPSPWYDIEDVEWTGRADPRHVRAWLRTVHDEPCEILVHGLNIDIDAWWRQLPDVARGPGVRHLHLVRTEHGAVAISTKVVRSN